MLQNTPHLLIALGVHEFENDELLALRDAAEGVAVVFCPTEAELSVALIGRAPSAICLTAPWSAERLSAVLHQLPGRPNQRVPVFLCGAASDLPLDSNGSFEIHRLSAPAPTLEMLEQSIVKPGKPAHEGISSRFDSPLSSETPYQQLPLEHASLPRFIGGIAHDFNNLLAAIIGDVQIASSRTNDPVVSKHLERANDACFRMAGEIRRLLAFQEGARERRGLVELGQVYRDTGQHVVELLGPGMEVETVESAEPLWVEASTSGLRQILVNLISYACQQVVSGNLIRISMRRQQAAPLAFVGEVPMRDEHALIEVEIRGVGAPAAPGARAFEPVFSRPVRDAGVSLAIVWKLVQDFDGTVSVLHDPTGATAFRIQLPLAHPSKVDAATQLATLRGTETLLVASTDRPAMETLLRNVRQLGYRVEVAGDLDTLSRALVRIANAPACVLIDTDCDLLNASEVHNTVRAVAPRMPILLAAPELSSLCHPPFSSDGLTCLVHKPLDIKEVLSTVRALSRPGVSLAVSSPATG